MLADITKRGKPHGTFTSELIITQTAGENMRPEIVPLEPRHADIIPRLRKADRDEIFAMEGIDPKLAVAYSIACASPGWAAELDGRTEAVFGVGTLDGGRIGRPWLVGTDEVEKHPVAFYRLSRGIIDEMKARYAVLENWVDARNKLSIRWLAWAGFHIEPAANVGYENMPFHRFWWAR